MPALLATWPLGHQETHEFPVRAAVETPPQGTGSQSTADMCQAGVRGGPRATCGDVRVDNRQRTGRGSAARQLPGLQLTRPYVISIGPIGAGLAGQPRRIVAVRPRLAAWHTSARAGVANRLLLERGALRQGSRHRPVSQAGSAGCWMNSAHHSEQGVSSSPFRDVPNGLHNAGTKTVSQTGRKTPLRPRPSPESWYRGRRAGMQRGSQKPAAITYHEAQFIVDGSTYW